MNTFSNQQIKQYKDDGFIIAKKLFSNDEITNISSWIDELVVRAPRIGKEMYYYEDDLRKPGEKILNRLEIMVSGQAALCCDMSYDRNFPVEKVDYGNVFDIGIEGVWANLTKEHQLIYDQTYSEKKLKLICNNCDRSGINSLGWTLDDTISRQMKIKQRFYT